MFMKRIALQGLILLCMCSLIGCTRTLEGLLTESDSVKVFIHESGMPTKTYTLSSNDMRFKALVALLERYNEGWEKTPASYLPGVVVRGQNVNLNFLGNHVIVNNSVGQFVRAIPPRDYDFLLE